MSLRPDKQDNRTRPEDKRGNKRDSRGPRSRKVPQARSSPHVSAGPSPWRRQQQKRVPRPWTVPYERPRRFQFWALCGVHALRPAAAKEACGKHLPARTRAALCTAYCARIVLCREPNRPCERPSAGEERTATNQRGPSPRDRRLSGLGGAIIIIIVGRRGGRRATGRKAGERRGEQWAQTIATSHKTGSVRGPSDSTSSRLICVSGEKEKINLKRTRLDDDGPSARDYIWQRAGALQHVRITVYGTGKERALTENCISHLSLPMHCGTVKQLIYTQIVGTDSSFIYSFSQSKLGCTSTTQASTPRNPKISARNPMAPPV